MTDNPDPMDQPEDEGMSLAVPFIVCQTNGGPYDDESFVAGFQSGQIDRALDAMAAVGAKSATYTIMTPLVKQLELIGMHRGFPNVTAEHSEEVPGWSFVTFTASGSPTHPLAPDDPDYEAVCLQIDDLIRTAAITVAFPAGAVAGDAQTTATREDTTNA